MEHLYWLQVDAHIQFKTLKNGSAKVAPVLNETPHSPMQPQSLEPCSTYNQDSKKTSWLFLGLAPNWWNRLCRF